MGERASRGYAVRVGPAAREIEERSGGRGSGRGTHGLRAGDGEEKAECLRAVDGELGGVRRDGVPSRGRGGVRGAPASVVKPGQKMRSRTREATRDRRAWRWSGSGAGRGGRRGGERCARAAPGGRGGARGIAPETFDDRARVRGSSATSAPRHPTTKGSTRVRTRTVPRRASASRDSTTGPYRSAPLSGSIRASARDTAVDTSVKRLSGLAARVARSVSSESATRTSAGVSGGRISDPPPRRAHQDASESEDASPSFSTVTTSRIADAELPMATRARSRSSEAADPSNGSRTFFSIGGGGRGGLHHKNIKCAPEECVDTCTERARITSPSLRRHPPPLPSSRRRSRRSS